MFNLIKKLMEAGEERAITRDEFMGKKPDEVTSEVPPPKWIKDMAIWDAAIASLKEKGTLMKDGKANYGALVAIYKNKLGKKGTEVKEYSGSYGAV